MATAGKKPISATENRLPELVDDAGTRMLADVNTANDIEKDEVLAAGIDIGRLEAMDFVLTISTSAMLAIYENVKKSKAWRYLRNPKNADGQHFQSLEEFCEVKMGKSYARLRELASNRKAIGQDAFEQAERLGLRQVDYNAIKALPAPDQELIRRAVEEASSREDVLGVLQELAARNASEIQSLQKKADDLQAEKDASDSLVEAKNKAIDRLQRQLKQIEKLPPEEAEALVLKEAADIQAETQGMVRGHLRQALIALQNLPEDQTLFMAGMVGQVMSDLVALRDEFNLPEVGGKPEWEKWAEKTGAATGKAN